MTAGEEAMVAKHRCFNLDRGGQEEEADIALPCHFGRILCLDGAAFDEILDRRPITVAEDRKLIALLANILRRAVPHEADADIADAFHPLPPDPVAWREPWHGESRFDKVEDGDRESRPTAPVALFPKAAARATPRRRPGGAVLVRARGNSAPMRRRLPSAGEVGRRGFPDRARRRPAPKPSTAAATPACWRDIVRAPGGRRRGIQSRC